MNKKKTIEECNAKWLAINIKVPEKPSEKEDLLIQIHADVISVFKDKVESWHFLWESAPFQHTLLTRFYGDAETIEKLEEAIVSLLDKEGIEWERDKKYEGEAKTYGSKGWEYLAKVLHLGSEFAIAIIENERKGIKTEEFKWSLSGYLERWIHLFMNQLLTRVSEAPTLFQLSVHRTAINMLGAEQYRRIAKDLDGKIPQLLRHHHETVIPLINELAAQKSASAS